MKFKEFMTDDIKHVFCDMDGCLADFEGHFEAKMGKSFDELKSTMSRTQSFKLTKSLPIEWWATMPWMTDGQELWKYLSENFESLHILSAPTQDVEEKAIKGKWEWLEKENIVTQLGKDRIIINAEKHKFVKPTGVSILIDDKQKKIDHWRKAGGVGILHTSTQNTIRELKEHLHI